jgi:hypothetical protein
MSKVVTTVMRRSPRVKPGLSLMQLMIGLIALVICAQASDERSTTRSIFTGEGLFGYSRKRAQRYFGNVNADKKHKPPSLRQFLWSFTGVFTILLAIGVLFAVLAPGTWFGGSSGNLLGCGGEGADMGASLYMRIGILVPAVSIIIGAVVIGRSRFKQLQQCDANEYENYVLNGQTKQGGEPTLLKAHNVTFFMLCLGGICILTAGLLALLGGLGVGVEADDNIWKGMFSSTIGSLGVFGLYATIASSILLYKHHKAMTQTGKPAGKPGFSNIMSMRSEEDRNMYDQARDTLTSDVDTESKQESTSSQPAPVNRCQQYGDSLPGMQNPSDKKRRRLAAPLERILEASL